MTGKKKNYKTYTANYLFKKEDKNKRIPGTEFLAGTTETLYLSKENSTPTPFSFVPAMTLSYKIGAAIASSQDENYNIYKGNYKSGNLYVGCFENGKKSKNDYFVMVFDNTSNLNTSWGTNIFSHHLFQMLIAISRYEGNSELDAMFESLDFDTEEKIIGANQKKPFFIAADNLYFVAKNKILNKSMADDVEENDFQVFLEDLDTDITGFVKKGYKKSVTAPAKELGVKESQIKYLEMPKKIEIPVTRHMRCKAAKDKYYDGIETFAQREIQNMPLMLQNGYELAKASFMANRDFFGEEEWELVDAIAQKDVRSINFTGPAGVGKTTTIRSIAGALGMPFILVGGSANIEEADLLGCRNVEAVDGVSITTWSDGPIAMAIRYGAFLLFDEVNAADPGILMKLNTILDGSKSLILNTSEEIKVHPNFVYAEAMNVGAAYAGTDQMNQSHFDRMDEMFKIATKSPEEEAKIISANTGYDNIENLKKMCIIKQHILDLIMSEGDASEQICSPRRLICWAKKAKRTGEFIESSLSTVIAHLSIYDESFSHLTVEEVLNSDGIAATVMDEIKEQFEGVVY